MKTALGIIRKFWLPLLIIITIVFYVANLLIKGPPATSPTPSSSPVGKIASFGTLTPGTSTGSDIEKVFGRPINTTVDKEGVVSQYKSTNQYRFHEVVFTNGVASLIKEIVNSNDNTNATSITSVYGEAPNILYNNLPNATFNLYVYPANGIAYLGHTDGTLLEIWYFQPTTIDVFASTWGQGYSSTLPSGNNTY